MIFAVAVGIPRREPDLVVLGMTVAPKPSEDCDGGVAVVLNAVEPAVTESVADEVP